MHQGPLVFTIGCNFWDDVPFYVVSYKMLHLLCYPQIEHPFESNNLLQDMCSSASRQHEYGGYGRYRGLGWERGSHTLGKKLFNCFYVRVNHFCLDTYWVRMNLWKATKSSKTPITTCNHHLLNRACRPRGKTNVIDAIVRVPSLYVELHIY